MTALLAVSISGTYTDMPTPSSYEVSPQEIVDTEGRTVSGLLVMSRICIKRQITLAWNRLTPTDHLILMNATAENSFMIRYFDTSTHEFAYGTFYRGSDLKDAPITNLKSSSGAPWSGSQFGGYTTSMTLTEF